MATTEHKSLAEALAAFQGEAPTLHKANEVKGSFSYKYIDLADIVEAIKPLMLKHGLSWSAFPCIGPDGKAGLRYKLSHVSGDCESEVMSLMLAKADAQAHGSSITYARRYALCAVLNIVADADDDGAAAKAAQDRARAQNGNSDGNSEVERPLLHEEGAKLVLEAIGRAKMGTDWVRSQLVALGVQSVPEGPLMKSTILGMTPEQAVAMVKVCDEAAEAKAASK